MIHVVQLVDHAWGLAAVAPALTAVRSTVVARDEPLPRWRRIHLVHAHEGTHAAGRRLADRLGVPLVVTAEPGEPVAVAADLVLRLDDVPGPGRHVVPDRPGTAADLEDWYRALVAGRTPPPPEPPPGRPTVTVVVPTFDRADLLAVTLDALADQTYPAEHVDVVVVDNGSTDTTPAVLARAGQRLGDRLTVLRNEHNTSAAAARNRGVAAASGDVVAFTDDDCRPTPTWLARLVGAFRPGVGIVQGRTCPAPGVALGPTARSQWTSREHGLYETCNIAYRRADLLALGPAPFPVELHDVMTRHLGARVAAQAFGEDVDVAWRIKRRGVGSRFVADAVVHHHVFTSDVGYLLRRSLLVAGFPVLVRRHPELRETFLYARVFLSRRHLLALGGLLAAASGSPIAAVAGTAPYAWELLRPDRPGRRQRLAGASLRAARDVLETAALVYGSVRARAVVL